MPDTTAEPDQAELQRLRERVAALERCQADAASATLQLRDQLQRRTEALALLRSLLHHLPNGSVNVFDRDLRYHLAEGQGLAQVGLSSAMLVGKTLREVFPEEQVQVVEPPYQRAFAGETVAFDLSLGEHTYLVTASRLPGGWKGTEAIVVAVQNITEQRAEARQQQDFLAMITHDLKGPLTTIQAYAQLMQRRKRSDERTLAMIIQQSHYLGRLIDDLTDLARLAGGQLVLERVPVNLTDLVEQTSSQARMTTTDHRIQVVTPEPPVIGVWDSDRLARVLQNLLGNAIKYSPAGGTIAVTVTEEAETVSIAVQDQGLGIPPEALPRLFDRFYRTEAVRVAGIEGTGLGLAICKGLVEAHGGQMRVESQVGRGSTFTVTLPRS